MSHTQFDANIMRDYFIGRENPMGINDVFTFYYDESNNIRKLHLTNKGLNVEKACNFVLAGILHKGEHHSADFISLKKGLNLQESTKEIKLKHIGKGSFQNILASEKLGTLLQWLLDNDFYLHYFNLNVLFWSIVDIVDSVIKNSDPLNKQLFTQSHILLKSDLYKTIVNNESYFLEKLKEFEYPNIKNNMVEEFATFLINFVKSNTNILNQDRRYLLDRFIESAEGSTELFFIMNENDHILISDFFVYYLKNTYLFKNSKHFFDEEKVVSAKFSESELVDNGVTLNNYTFVDSKEFTEVQISDVIAGLLAKYFTFISDKNKGEVIKIKGSLNKKQIDNLRLIKALIDKSDNVSAYFFYSIASEDETKKSNYFIHNLDLT